MLSAEKRERERERVKVKRKQKQAPEDGGRHRALAAAA
jgi:hypothetical protein